MARCYRNNVLDTNDVILNNCNSNNIVNNTTNCNRNECMMDSLVDLLGRNCSCQFNTQNNRGLEEVNGILDEVGNDYIALRSTTNGRRTICNTDNLQFVKIL